MARYSRTLIGRELKSRSLLQSRKLINRKWLSSSKQSEDAETLDIFVIDNDIILNSKVNKNNAFPVGEPKQIDYHCTSEDTYRFIAKNKPDAANAFIINGLLVQYYKISSIQFGHAILFLMHCSSKHQ